MQEHVVSGVRKRPERADLGVAGVGQQRQGLVGVGGDHDAVEPVDLVALIAYLDPVAVSGDVAHRTPDPDRGQSGLDLVH